MVVLGDLYSQVDVEVSGIQDRDFGGKLWGISLEYMRGKGLVFQYGYRNGFRGNM